MSDKTIKGLFNRLRDQKNSQDLRASKYEIGSADQSLIVNKSDQPGWWSRFLIKQSGGYHPQYYRKDEVEDTTRLAIAKFASVSFATYSFMKAVSPAFDSSTIKALPSIYGADPKLILTGATAAGFWWMLSKLDTAVLHNMRAHKASAGAADQYGIYAENNTKTSTIAGSALRYGVSLGSLAISIPALLVTVAEKPVDQYLQNRIKTEYNDPIINEYQGKLDGVTGEITRLTGLLTPLEERLIAIDADEDALTYTEEQQQRRNTLNTRLQTLENQKRTLELERLEETRKKDEAVIEAGRQLEGTNGAIAGPGKRYRDAIANQSNANIRIEGIDAAIEGVVTQIDGINDEFSEMDKMAQVALDSRNEAEENLRANLQDQITVIRNQIAVQNELKNSANDVASLAQKDPRWVTYDPNLFDQIDGYIEYMQEEANPFQWMSAGAIALMIACMELGVFTLAASRQVGAGEIRGYIASVLRSDEAGKIYEQVLARKTLEEEVGLDPAVMELRKKKQVMEAEAEVFDRVLRKAMTDSGIEEAMHDDIVADLQELRYKRSHKMDDVPQPDETVSPEKPHPEKPYKPNGLEPRPENLG